MPIITNLCGNAHPKSFPCRECEYLARKRDEKVRLVEAAVSRPESVSEDGAIESAGVEVERSGGDVDVPPPSKPERLERAKKALTRAQISKRQREKDPEAYRKWNRERMKEARKHGKRDP